MHLSFTHMPGLVVVFVPMSYVSGRAGPGDFVAGVVRMAAEEVLILLQQERTHRVAHASQCLASGQSCNPVICGQMSQDFFTTVHDRLPLWIRS